MSRHASWLTKQAFLENVSLVGRKGAVANACWAAQVASFLHFMSPIVDGAPQHIDPDAASAVLQRSYFESVNGSEGRKVREWLELRGGPVHFCTYEPAGYLQAVASRTNRVRLAQFRTGSHWLRVETGRWAGLKREQRCCQRCCEAEIDDAPHMIWGCPALIDQRLQHMGLFSDCEATIEAFMQQNPVDLAVFVRHCAERCAELEACGLVQIDTHSIHAWLLCMRRQFGGSAVGDDLVLCMGLAGGFCCCVRRLPAGVARL